MSVPPPSVPPQELRVAPGRRAYRWPLRIGLAALALAALAALAAQIGLWDADDALQVVILLGIGASAAAAWAAVIFRTRLVVTIDAKGLVLRRGGARASVPVSALDAVGIAWPVADPVWTVWFDPAAAPGVAAVTKTEGGSAPLLRGRLLPPGRLDAVRDAATGTLGVPWRVVDDAGEEVEPPPPNALTRADRVTVDDRGRYRSERGGALLAVACGRRRTVVLRDPYAAPLLVFKRPPLGGDRMRVLDADGRLIGRVRGSREPSFHAADGMLLGTTRGDGGRYVVTGVDGRESASLRRARAEGGDDGRWRLHRSPSAPAALRALTLALPMLVGAASRPS
ncbi:hypothetical protein [Actinomadura decatromicini]|uniref:Uncharacterized protein n=1 Tax=Actinomadura decatromicini TaxID=2604572 RepID=A0A5D3FA00_9ACTN|nr:hypothetical protein [Actinomadura decatromicini]TYK44912.1 hypothetical protein FXF68_29850 [Actinomadura decatromicini]